MADTQKSTHPIKILLVEERKRVLPDIIPILQKFGYDVVGSAKDGDDAIALTKKLDIDLILMGIDIPGLLNGIEAARIIHFISKPFTPQDFTIKVRHILNGQNKK